MLYGHQLLPVEVPLLEETEARDVKYLPCSTHVGKWQTRGLSRLAPAPTNPTIPLCYTLQQAGLTRLSISQGNLLGLVDDSAPTALATALLCPQPPRQPFQLPAETPPLPQSFPLGSVLAAETPCKQHMKLGRQGHLLEDRIPKVSQCLKGEELNPHGLRFL